MCTVSWVARPQGYDLFFNRDELTTRAPETPPILAQHEGVAYLAPRDGNSGGTWLLANFHGLTFGLLNDYGASWRPAATAPRFSRGHVVLACAALATPADAVAVVGALPLARTPAFHLVVLAPDAEPFVLHWNGTELIQSRPPLILPPQTSSSFATAEVIATRKSRFGSFVQSPSRPEVRELAAYHRQHDPNAGAHSVLMCRPDAATRSITHVTVTAGTVAMHYETLLWTSGGPETAATINLTLPRTVLA
jgi:Transport and Golgi organisation 2